MYFTDSKSLQRFERDMRVIPNFERKEVWEYADSCSGCRNCTIIVSVLVTGLSCLLPVRSATDVDPALVLKGE